MWTDSARAKYARPAKRYASDLTDAEFALIEPWLPLPCRRGGPRKTDLRAVLEAIFYLLRTGFPREPPSRLPSLRERMIGAAYHGPCCPRASRPRARYSATSADGGRIERCSACPTPCWSWPGSGRLRGAAHRRDRRQPVGQDRRGRRAARRRRRHEDPYRSIAAGRFRCADRSARRCRRWPPAPRPGRYARLAAARDRPSRQHPGPRRARPVADPHSPPLPLAATAVRRWRLPGRGRGDGRARGATGPHHRQALRSGQGLRRPAAPLGRRAQLRLVRPQPAAGQGRGDPDRQRHRHALPRRHPPAHPPARNSSTSNNEFSDGL